MFFLAALSLIACVSPKKKKEDVGFIGRKFQDLTAYYNGYYNANELINNGIDQIIKRNPDNYQELLPIDPVTINRDTNAAGADLKKAVEKLKRVIYLHPASEWVPDSYFLMGKSQYLKRDFETAENSFKYVTQEYSPEKIAKAKSKGKKSAKKKSKKKKSSKKKSTKKENTPTTKSNTTTNKSTTVNKPATTKTTTKKSTKKKSSKKKSKKKKSSSKNKSSSKQTTLKKTNKQKEDIQVEEIQKKEGEKDETTTAIVKTTVESSETQEEDIEIEKIDPIVESKPKKYFLKHKPIYQAARLWLAKTYIERANYDDAGRILRDLKENEGTFNDIRREAYLTHAYLELKNENIVGAIPQLESALTLIKTKKQKARINFILGQLYSTLNKHEAAYEKFASVDKYKPVYEMGFNAKLNMYREQLAIGKISYDELIAKLNKMSKDLKNDEFKDQIYFLLADVALHQNNTNQAITYLQQGIRANKKGTEAKADQFLKIANLFYDREDYINAYHYYDSAAVGYPAKKPYASLIKERQSSLKDIAINLETIQLQDSLLRIAALSKEEQEAFAKRILRERRKNDDKSSTNTGQTNVFDPKGFNRNQGLNAMGLNNQGGLPLTGPKPSTFFAYNEKALKEGKRQFEKVWGNRPLVDNWRVSSMITDFGQNIATNTEDPINKLFISKSEIESVLSEIPNDEISQKIANSLIAKAMNDLGKLYPENIDRYDKGIKVLEDLIVRYPGSNFEPEAYYKLYFAYLAIGNQAKADYYADLLKTKYAGNPFSIYFTDPEYAKRSNEKADKLEKYYQATYDSLIAQNYRFAYDMSNQSDSIFGNNNKYMAKFMMIKAMSVGNLQGKDAYTASLKSIVNKLPGTDEERRAKEMLRLLGSGADESEKQLTEAEKIYKENPADQHFILIVLNPEITAVDDVKNAVASYNDKYFKQANLKIANITLRDKSERQTIIVRSFDGKIKSMEYYNQARNRKSEFISAKYPYDIFCISNDNYRELLRTKDVELYNAWFTKYYRNQ